MPARMCNKGMVVYKARKRYLGKWQLELGIKHSPDRYSEEHRNMTFAQAQSLY
jgi:hypothetical protein